MRKMATKKRMTMMPKKKIKDEVEIIYSTYKIIYYEDYGAYYIISNDGLQLKIDETIYKILKERNMIDNEK